jgi:hypothetical protein
MAVDGVVADEQLFGNRLVGQPIGDQPQDLELANRQAAVIARTGCQTQASTAAASRGGVALSRFPVRL